MLERELLCEEEAKNTAHETTYDEELDQNEAWINKQNKPFHDKYGGKDAITHIVKLIQDGIKPYDLNNIIKDSFFKKYMYKVVRGLLPNPASSESADMCYNEFVNQYLWRLVIQTYRRDFECPFINYAAYVFKRSFYPRWSKQWFGLPEIPIGSPEDDISHDEEFDAIKKEAIESVRKDQESSDHTLSIEFVDMLLTIIRITNTVKPNDRRLAKNILAFHKLKFIKDITSRESYTEEFDISSMLPFANLHLSHLCNDVTNEYIIIFKKDAPHLCVPEGFMGELLERIKRSDPNTMPGKSTVQNQARSWVRTIENALEKRFLELGREFFEAMGIGDSYDAFCRRVAPM